MKNIDFNNKFNSVNLNNISFYFFSIQIAFMHLYVYYGGLDYIYFIPFINQLLPFLGAIFMVMLFFYKLKFNIYNLMFMMFILYIFIYSFTHYCIYLIIDENFSLKYFANDIFSIIQFIFFFFIGAYFRGYSQFKKYIYFFYILFLINIILNFNFETFGINLINNDKENNDYLFLADTFAIWSILTLAYTKSYNNKLLIIFISIIGLFTLMSRASLAVFILTVLFYFVYSRKFKINFLYFLFIGLIITIYLFTYSNFEELVNHRMFKYLNFGEDQSANERIIIFIEGLNSIKNNWFIGDYGQEVIYFGKLGTYIHNFLQLLRQFGIIPFIIFSFFCFILINNAYKIIKTTKIYDADYLFLLLLTVFSLLELIFARSLNSGHPYFFFLVGAFLSMRQRLI